MKLKNQTGAFLSKFELVLMLTLAEDVIHSLTATESNTNEWLSLRNKARLFFLR